MFVLNWVKSRVNTTGVSSFGFFNLQGSVTIATIMDVMFSGAAAPPLLEFNAEITLTSHWYQRHRQLLLDQLALPEHGTRYTKRK